jgi:hypothetical protein
MYGVPIFEDRQMIGKEGWIGRPLEGVIRLVHNT